MWCGVALPVAREELPQATFAPRQPAAHDNSKRSSCCVSRRNRDCRGPRRRDRARGRTAGLGDDREAQLAKLTVKPAAPMTGYSRDKFGEPWEDVDHNGCDTRNDILKRDLTKIVFKAGSSCLIATGTLNDPYTGQGHQLRPGREDLDRCADRPRRRAR